MNKILMHNTIHYKSHNTLTHASFCIDMSNPNSSNLQSYVKTADILWSKSILEQRKEIRFCLMNNGLLSVSKCFNNDCLQGKKPEQLRTSCNMVAFNLTEFMFLLFYWGTHDFLAATLTDTSFHYVIYNVTDFFQN